MRRIGVPHRRQGRPPRPYTHSSSPVLVLPVVVRFDRNRLAHNMSRARFTTRIGSGSAHTGLVGKLPTMKHNSLQYTFPTPAITR